MLFRSLVVSVELNVVPAAGALVALLLVLGKGQEAGVVSCAAVSSTSSTAATAWWAVPAIVVAALWGAGGRIGGGLSGRLGGRVRRRIRRGVGRGIRGGVRGGVTRRNEGGVGRVEEVREVKAWKPGVELGPEV